MNHRQSRTLALALTILFGPSGSCDERDSQRGRPPLRIPGQPAGHRRPCPSPELEAAVAPAWIKGAGESGYQVLVAPSEALLLEDKGTLWDSGKVASSQSLHVAYGGKPLASHHVCWWKVRVPDQDGTSPPGAHLRDGPWVSRSRDWKAKWIGRDSGEESDELVTALKDAAWIGTREGNQPSAPRSVPGTSAGRSACPKAGGFARRSCSRRPTIHLSPSSMAGRSAAARAGPRSSDST